jgi:Dolichyl-phosphate-mannose-protein mannosyltransferase
MKLMRTRTIYALLIFAVAFALRIPLVDNIYQYSFEPDSESCVAVTRSFYFFFKSPGLDNAPQTLDTYPNYSDGDFITSALFANLVRPLSKGGFISAQLGDGDNRLVIFSMRWCGVLFDAMAALVAFLILVLLIGDTWIAMPVTLLYYLLNRQTLDIDLIRIDHFGLFTANLAMLAGVLLFQYPRKAKYYILTGAAAALVTGTKMNFPFYLLMLFILFIHLVHSKKVSFKNFVIALVSFLLATAFMYQRWLMYPENIGMVLRFTLNNGKVWTAFWGTGNHSYYLWDEFFSRGYSIAIVVLLVGAYASFIGGCMQGVAKKDSLLLILCAVFYCNQ